MRGCSCRGTAGFAHVSCLAEQAKILVVEAEDNNLGDKAFDERWARWSMCGLCEQDYHGVVACALGWACWQTYVGRPATNYARGMAMTVLGNGVFDARLWEDALSVYEAELSMQRRLGASEDSMLVTRNNLAGTYQSLGRLEDGLRLRRDIYAGCLRRYGEENNSTLRAANNYAVSLKDLQLFEEAKCLLRKVIPVTRRIVGADNQLTLRMRKTYARVLYRDKGATLDDLREAVTTLEETTRTAQRVLGGAHPLVVDIVRDLQFARAALGARDVEPLRDAVGAMRV